MTTSLKYYRWIAAGFGSGWLPKAPGTWGTLLALLPLGFSYHYLGAPSLFVLALAFTLLGCWVCAQVLPHLEQQDPGWIVMDEWAGVALCMGLMSWLISDALLLMLASFIGFRAFDILKPWPIPWFEHQGPHWWSIMADDLVAAVLAAGVLGLGMMLII